MRNYCHCPIILHQPLYSYKYLHHIYLQCFQGTIYFYFSEMKDVMLYLVSQKVTLLVWEVLL